MYVILNINLIKLKKKAKLKQYIKKEIEKE